MLFYLLNQPILILPVVAALLIAFTIHEFSHALAADKLGDTTARDHGRLTLNPLAHMHPIGFLLLMTAGFGFGKPVPFDDRNLKNPRWGSAFIGAAGPLSNLVLATISVFLLVLLVSRGMAETSLLYVFLLFLAQFNVALLVFNLLPIPPLDGSKVLFALLPDSYDRFKQQLAINGPIILLFVILFDSLSPRSLFAGVFFRVLSGIESLVTVFI